MFYPPTVDQLLAARRQLAVRGVAPVGVGLGGVACSAVERAALGTLGRRRAASGRAGI